MTEFTGEFETHITVCLRDSCGMEALTHWSAQQGFKCLHIILDRGSTVSQPMLTRRGRGGLTGELKIALQASKSLAAAGFQVTRIKIEAAPWNQDVPQSQTDALQHPPATYFEHHIKLLLEPDADRTTLTRIATQHNAHLSRNALRVRSDGLQERFVTQRCHLIGRREAAMRLRALQDALAPPGFPIIEIEEEFVVYDSNLDLDAGWIKTEE